jgi:hypothetical protein
MHYLFLFNEKLGFYEYNLSFDSIHILSLAKANTLYFFYKTISAHLDSINFSPWPWEVHQQLIQSSSYPILWLLHSVHS